MLLLLISLLLFIADGLVQRGCHRGLRNKRSPDAASGRTVAYKMTTCEQEDQEEAEEHGSNIRALVATVVGCVPVTCNNSGGVTGLDRLPCLMSL